MKLIIPYAHFIRETMMCSRLLLFLSFVPYVLSSIVTYNWDITYVNVSPDGYSRRVIGINGEWPCPPIKVATSD
jgi:iron transport multicopper oxidase